MKFLTVAYLSSHFLSLVGNGIAAIALPLIVLKITGSPLSMGVISVTTAVPAVLVGLAAGILIDHWNRRDLSVVADVISAASIAALPIVDAIWGLELWSFVILGIVGTFGDIPGATAREVLVATVAQRTAVPLERLIGIRQTLTAIALIVGPASAGALVAFLGSSTVFFVVAATSSAAAILTLVVPRAAGKIIRDSNPPETPWQQVIGGFSVLRRSRFLTATVVLTVGLTVVGAGLQGLVLPLHFTSIARPEILGLVLTVMAAGMLVGAFAFSTAGSRIRRRLWLFIGFVSLTTGFVAISTLASLPIIFVGSALVGVGNAVLGGVLGVLQVEKTPDHARGRVLALQNSALQMAAPVGIGGAGLLAEAASPTIAAFAVTTVWVIALVVAILTRSLHNLEQEQEVTAHAQS